MIYSRPLTAAEISQNCYATIQPLSRNELPLVQFRFSFGRYPTATKIDDVFCFSVNCRIASTCWLCVSPVSKNVFQGNAVSNEIP